MVANNEQEQTDDWILNAIYMGNNVFNISIEYTPYALPSIVATGTLTVIKNGTVIDTDNNFEIDNDVDYTTTSVSIGDFFEFNN